MITIQLNIISFCFNNDKKIANYSSCWVRCSVHAFTNFEISDSTYYSQNSTYYYFFCTYIYEV